MLVQEDKASLAPAFSSTSQGSMQQQKSSIGQISLSRFEVILTAVLMEQISQNGPKTKLNISRGIVATVCR